MKPQTPLATIGALVQSVSDSLEKAHSNKALAFGHGTNNAFDEAAWLCLWSLNLPLDALGAVWQQAVTPAQVEKTQALLQQRLQSRKPLAYLTREAWLQGLSFYVDERSIIPRSLLAECIAQASIDPWLTLHSYKALDLCTGNGSLAVLCAMAYPDLHIDACDICENALAVAHINRKRHALTQRIVLFQSDGLDACFGPYDLILCNPPYVNNQSMAALPKEYRQEPSLALAGGMDGMNFIRLFLLQASNVLGPKGVVVLEIGNERTHFEAIFPQLEGIWLSTSAGDDQVLLLQREQLPVSKPF